MCTMIKRLEQFANSTKSFSTQVEETRWAPLISPIMLIPEDSVMKVWSIYENRTIRDSVNRSLKSKRKV